MSNAFLNSEGEGQDPRQIADWSGYPGDMLVGLKAIRAKCLDCAHTQGEVKKCRVVACPLWPLRMGSVPKEFAAERQRREDARPKGEQPEHLRKVEK